MNPARDADGSASVHDATRRELSAVPQVEERPLGEIANGIWIKAELLIRQELQLGLADLDERVERLKDDVSQRFDQLKIELVGKAIGATILLVGVAALAAAAIMALDFVMSPWVAALLVGITLIVGGASLLRRRIQLPKGLPARELIPQRSINSIDQDVKAIKEATK